MPVRMDQVLPLAKRPSAPRPWVWAALLMLFLLLAGGAEVLFAEQPLHERPLMSWGMALGGALLGWCLLMMGRVLLYLGQHRAADGWDQAREQEWTEKMAQGRRFMQVLKVSLYTALRAPGQTPEAQVTALLEGTKVIKTQPSWRGEATRHSRLWDDQKKVPEENLLDALSLVLTELSETLALLPDDTPLAVMLESDSGLPEAVLSRLWHQAWSDSGIRQPTSEVQGRGLDGVDQWLDQRSEDRSLLLVVAFQVAPEHPINTAEAIAALLLGNPQMPSAPAPKAHLHRPQQALELCREAWMCAVDQSLQWATAQATTIERIWRVGSSPQQEQTINAVMVHDHNVHHVDSLLGHPGKVSPWLAVAVAVQGIEQGIGTQIIFSGSSDGTEFWSTVVTPASAREI